jgi:hypothetical protein
MSIYLRWLEFIAVLPRVSHLISNILKYRREVTNRGKTDVLSNVGYVLLLINAGVRNSVSERKKYRRLLHYV